MSELITTHDNRATIRWKLLTGASALALTAYVSSTALAKADDTDRPTVWIELGGQMDSLQGTSSDFIAPFMLKTPTPGPYHDNIFVNGQKPPRFAFGFDGLISFQPTDSDWIFSASVRHGRADSKGHIHQQTLPTLKKNLLGNYNAAYADITSSHKEDHDIVDFSVGRDVGLGAFGNDGHSTVSAGVRFAQFSASSNVNAYGRPSIIPYYFHSFVIIPGFYGYSMRAQAKRKFDGVGPSLSWDGSATLAGNKQDGELTLDWGVNGAVLFGRQRTKLNHTTHAYYLPASYYNHYHVQSLYRRPHPADRSRSVSVPNIGGFAGLSLKWPNAKLSIGYRADYFFGAIDGGIDGSEAITGNQDLAFNGLYASISIGLGSSDN